MTSLLIAQSHGIFKRVHGRTIWADRTLSSFLRAVKKKPAFFSYLYSLVRPSNARGRTSSF